MNLAQTLIAETHLGPPEPEARVFAVSGAVLRARTYGAAVGDLFRVDGRGGELLAEVIAVEGEEAILMPYGSTQGIGAGTYLTPDGDAATCWVGDGLLGRMWDALGRPLDGGGALVGEQRVPLYAYPPTPEQRGPVEQRMELGVTALDVMVPTALGQRLGIYAGPGVGKSTLLEMLARGASDVDVIVIALIGERGREAQRLAQKVLSESSGKRVVMLAATSDRPATERVRAAFAAMTIAEYFRDSGANVLFLFDSLTRLCGAQREVGLAAGEAPATRGYPSSVFALLPRLVERVCPLRGAGTITGLFTVLVDEDDPSDVVGEYSKGLLDGHIVLSKRLAEQGVYPAIDILRSLSRLQSDISTPEHVGLTEKIRAIWSKVERAADLVSVGMYQKGADPELDRALLLKESLQVTLSQPLDEVRAFDTSCRELHGLLEGGSRP